MRIRGQKISGRRRRIAATILLAAATLGTGSGRADDRLLLRQSPADPLMFILFDTSGSMAEQPVDSKVPIGSADDPASKMYQAKQALYTALLNNPDVHYGFASFNQDDIQLRRKHWVYKANADGAWGANPLSYPALNVTYIFGGEDNGGVSAQGTCSAPITVPTSGFADQLRWHPRAGDKGNKATVYFLRQSSRTYRTTTTVVSGNLGDSTISVKVVRERNTSCAGAGTYDTAEQRTVTFDLVRQALSQLQATNTAPNPDQVYGSDDVPLGPATGPAMPPASFGVIESCAGMDPNTDSLVDRYKLPTTINPSYPTNPKFDRGDFLPFDWNVTNRDEILRRLAPNLRGAETVPDFSQARYFKVETSGDVATINPGLVSGTQVPLIAQGFTPLGNSMNGFRDWYAGCHDQEVCTPGSGWVDVAQADDPLFGCRGKYLLILTDGLDTCGGDGDLGPACEGARILFEKYGVETFVIAFGQVSVAGNVLSCLADRGSGGTVQPFNPQDQAGLNNALESIFERVTQTSRSFSSAAVPTVQANFEDTIYVPTFTPLNAASYVEPSSTSRGAGGTWDGHLNAFLKPIPINRSTGKPDTMIPCTSTKRSGCFLWDAGAQLLTQAPTMAELNPVSPATPLWNIGSADNERRLFYPAATVGSTVPVTRRLFLPQSTLATQQDLWEGMKLVADPGNSAQVAAANAKVETTIKYTLQEKVASVTVPGDTKFVLGDIFHANPVLVSAPNRIAYFDADVPNPPGTSTPCSTNKGYRCFRTKHQLRRRLVAVGSNEGEIHLIDAGIYRDDVTPAAFDNGTGKEAFAFIPRPMLEHLRLQAEDNRQDWGVDGTVQVDDVFIDPSHTGTPTSTEREWRTILIGGLREGGAGYYALDVTQPDTFDGGGIPRPLSGTTYVPSCWNGGTGCGPVPFGSVLWSFSDTSDEDANSVVDLGDTWSTPNTGRIRILTDALSDPKQYEDHYVAVFGGGMDPSRMDKTGNWLYMVDVETGKILYKRVLDGSAPSDPAAVDTDLDGYLDRIYIGTTKGSLYKVDLTKDAQLVDIGGGVLRITSTDWSPFRVFDTASRPIYFPPSVVFDSKSGFFAVGFGTGDREDLWSTSAAVSAQGRFYFLLDTGWHVQGVSELPSINTTLPKTESDFVQISLTTALQGSGVNLLNAPPIGSQSGWIMQLGANERLISKSLTLSGISVFTGFVPKIRPNALGLCERNGTSNIYTVLATNGDAVLGTQPADRRRVVLSFVTNPFVETNISKNPRGDDDTPPPTGAVCRPSSEAVRTLRSLFPSGCKFTAYTQDIKTFQVDTELVCVAAIPVCVREQNWRDQ